MVSGMTYDPNVSFLPLSHHISNETPLLHINIHTKAKLKQQYDWAVCIIQNIGQVWQSLVLFWGNLQTNALSSRVQYTTHNEGVFLKTKIHTYIYREKKIENNSKSNRKGWVWPKHKCYKNSFLFYQFSHNGGQEIWWCSNNELWSLIFTS